MQDIFKTVKEAVPMREAARLLGVDCDRAGMALCPFHDDHTPSLRLYDDHYYCFGCHAHGDAIDLAAFMTGLRPYLAARFLASELGLPIETESQNANQSERRELK